MSYREQRNVTDLLRRMGYPRLISLESFRQPNFFLVADILHWFIKQYDPTMDYFTLEIQTEQQRVKFIRTFVQNMLRRTGLKLNGKRLYQGDGYAVKEIIKVINFFNNATIESLETKKYGGNTEDAITHFYELQPTLHKVRNTRELSSNLTDKGITFYDLISKEIGIRSSQNNTILSKNFDLNDYEQILKKGIGAIKSEESKLRSTIESSEGTIGSLNVKIEKKKQELERSEQRIETMSKVRPAYMDEYERIQRELEVLYYDYVTRFRILSHLQHQMEEINRFDDIKRSDSKLFKFDTRDHRFSSSKDNGDEDGLTDSELDDDEEEDDEEDEDDESILLTKDKIIQDQQLQRPKRTASKNSRNPPGRVSANALVMPNPGRSARNNIGGGGTRAAMNMYGAIQDEDEESESDLLLLEGDNSDSDIDEETDLGLAINNGLYAGTKNDFSGKIRRDSARLSRPIPPAPAGSLHNLGEQLLEVDDFEKEFIGDGSTMSNGINHNHHPSESRRGSGSYGQNFNSESLTKPLKPEPRYNVNGGPELLGSSGKSGTFPGNSTIRPTTKRSAKRVNNGGNYSGNTSDRPTNDRVTQLLDELKDDDDL